LNRSFEVGGQVDLGHVVLAGGDFTHRFENLGGDALGAQAVPPPGRIGKGLDRRESGRVAVGVVGHGPVVGVVARKDQPGIDGRVPFKLETVVGALGIGVIFQDALVGPDLRRAGIGGVGELRVADRVGLSQTGARIVFVPVPGSLVVPPTLGEGAVEAGIVEAAEFVIGEVQQPGLVAVDVPIAEAH
jgi:hypothetical protein